MKYFIGGVNASGKTTFLTKLKENSPEWEVVKSSQAFMNYLNIGSDYEKLRSLPEEIKAPKLDLMMREILNRPGNLVVDSHYLNLVRGLTSPVTSEWIKDFDALILLKISPVTALKRINEDNRDRALFPEGLTPEEKLIMYGQYIADYEKEFERLAEFYNLPSFVIDGEKEVDKKIEDFLRFTITLAS